MAKIKIIETNSIQALESNINSLIDDGWDMIDTMKIVVDETHSRTIKMNGDVTTVYDNKYIQMMGKY